MNLLLGDPAFLSVAAAVSGGGGYDADAQAYITAVETADGQALETAVKDAINAFVVGCKADGIWNAIKASCILAGARTLNGALVPLTGVAPTNNGFVGAGTDYDRKTGLVGDGAAKFLDSNRNNNADPQNSKHLALYLTEKGNNITVFASAGFANRTGETSLGWVNSFYAIINSLGWGSASTITYSGFTPSLFGASRNSSASLTVRGNSLNQVLSRTSEVPYDGNVILFKSSPDTAYRSSARIAFYRIGESLDLALLDARVATLINAFAAAIP